MAQQTISLPGVKRERRDDGTFVWSAAQPGDEILFFRKGTWLHWVYRISTGQANYRLSTGNRDMQSWFSGSVIEIPADYPIAAVYHYLYPLLVLVGGVTGLEVTLDTDPEQPERPIEMTGDPLVAVIRFGESKI